MPRIASGDVAMTIGRHQPLRLVATAGNTSHSGPAVVHRRCFAVPEATLGVATFIRRAELYFLEDESPLAALFTMMAGGPTWASIYRRR